MESPVKNNLGVQSYFQTWANQFDDLYEIEKHNKTVLDVGCGSGRQLIYAVTQGALKATGIDFSKDMLEIAQSAAAKFGVEGKLQLIEGDIHRHHFAGQFNAVYALGVFDYVADPVKLLANMRGLASEIVIASFPEPSLIRMPLRKVRYAMRGCPVYSYRKKQLDQIAQEAGFTNYKIERFASCGFIFYGYKVDG
jgi:SAM-dependent methyltransferase